MTITQICHLQIVTNLSHLPIRNIYNNSQSPHKVHASTPLQPVQHVSERVSESLREKSRESIARHPTAIIVMMVRADRFITVNAVRYLGRNQGNVDNFYY